MDHDLDQINAVPLVDVMLVLLAIVLTTATFVSTGQIPVDLAKAKHQETGRSGLAITLKPTGDLYLNERLVSVDDLGAALGPYPKTLPVVVRADRTVVLERFVSVVDVVKGRGFTRVGLEVER